MPQCHMGRFQTKSKLVEYIQYSQSSATSVHALKGCLKNKGIKNKEIEHYLLKFYPFLKFLFVTQFVNELK